MRVTSEMDKRKWGQGWISTHGRVWMIRWGAFFCGLAIMALGIAMMVRADWGLAPWDVLHMGLAIQTSLSVGTWLQAVGLGTILIAALLDKKIPGPGAILNMILVGWLVDRYLEQSWLIEPSLWWEKAFLMGLGFLLIAIGNGVYIAPRLGAGPRDGIVIAINKRWNYSISRVRMTMEISVLLLGWMLGGPVFIGTVLFSIFIGPFMQVSIRFWEKMMEQWLGRREVDESFDQRKVRTYYHDGFGDKARG
ncbi:hypothetical protein SAMN05444487_10568 [Marininema mesophilum]|uniref:Membrane protein YczE n=1 Tax=Marininema mesophilum TaxID=1048340 RepID=A0A1H2VD73_9BACL|nr:hypothetical protein [Marininema mesophilum]SDW66273.1 hypothetical protein SAMN05444487_10568 [Marininema mesophilum]